MTKLLYDKEWLDAQTDKFFVLDTCVLIELAKSPELQTVFREMNEAGCRLIITADVRDEFMRGAKTIAARKRCQKLIDDLLIAIFGGAERFGMTLAGAGFQMTLHTITAKEHEARRKVMGERVAKFKPSLIDERLLFLTTFTLANRAIVLVTSNYNDVPLILYNNDSAITICDNGGIRNIGFYSPKKKEIAQEISAATAEPKVKK